MIWATLQGVISEAIRVGKLLEENRYGDAGDAVGDRDAGQRT
jgi:hypothetical protein